MTAVKTLNPVARRYAEAYLNIVDRENQTGSIENELKGLQSLIHESEDLRLFLTSPLIGKGQKDNVVQALSRKAELKEPTENLLRLLARNRRMAMLEDVLAESRAILAERAGEIQAEIRSAFPLDDSQQAEIAEGLQKMTGQPVSVTVLTDPSLIGGLVIRYGSHLIDASVRNRLTQLHRKLTGQGGAPANDMDQGRAA